MARYDPNDVTLVANLTQVATTTTVTSSDNPSFLGETVKITATVSAVVPGGGVPTGTVTFSNGTTPLQTLTLDANGQATLSTAGLDVGSHAITASYSGDVNFTASTSDN